MPQREDFATRFSRLIDLLHKLRSPEGKTVASLAQEYGLSERSLIRDIRLLQESHFPIEELGRHRGYRLSPEFRLQPQALLADELLPLVLGAQLLGGRRAALGKLRNYVVNGIERRLTDELPDRVLPFSGEGRGLEWLEPLSRAIVARLRVDIDYRSSDEMEPGQRVIEPATLFLRSGNWYVDAFELAAEKFKTFRLSRISGVRLQQEVARYPRRPAQEAEFHPWDLAESEPAEAELEVGEGLAQWLQENPAHPSQRLEGTRVRYRVRAAEPFVRWVLGLSEARLLGPEALLSALRQRIRQLQDCYSTPGLD